MSYCQNCGAQTQPYDKFCPSCGANLETGQPMHEMNQQPVGEQFNQPTVNIENHLAKAIFSTVCCCIPFGIAAIIFAAQVKGKIEQGDVQGAQESADRADLWSNLSIGIGGVLIFIQVIISFMTHRY
jgi:uncharacterized membrane protein YvbJ